MSSSYPTGLDSFNTVNAGQPRNGSGASPQESILLTNLGDAIEAIQAELGLSPSGSFATVLLRFAAVEWNIRDFFVSGNLSVAAGVFRYRFPVACTLIGISATVNTAPTTQAIIIDVNKNGTTVFTTQGNRPQIAAGANATASEVTNMDVTAIAAGDYLTVDVDQTGSGTVGANLVVSVRYKAA